LICVKRAACRAPPLGGIVAAGDFAVPASKANAEALQIERLLAQVAPFDTLSPLRLAAVVRRARLQRVARGSCIMRRGEAPAGLFAVARGAVKIALRGTGGTERVLSFVGSGETFGEAAALLGGPAAADAFALTDTLLIVVASRPLKALMRDARFAQAMARLLAARLQRALAEVESSALHAADERLAAYLLSLGRPASDGGRWTARLPATKTLVAARLGIKKETLSRLFRELAGRGLITVARRDIALLDRERLAALAGR
jgi:CRP-like cAMP-binding protein